MKVLRTLACWCLGHAPITERRGDDSVLACERCHRLFEVFVRNLYAKNHPARPPLAPEEAVP